MLITTNVGGDPLVPAICIFGDSIVDVGNNNHLRTTVKANFPPYGRDFVGHRPTGRFANGKLATDFTAELLGFDSYPPAYLSQDFQGRNILIGANFASGASGYYDRTAHLYKAIPLTQQVEYYKEWQCKVENLVGRDKAKVVISGAIHLISAGSSDFMQNYYINHVLKKAYTVDQFSDFLMTLYSTFIQEVYNLGARRIGVTSLAPIGCLTAAMSLFGSGHDHCVEKLNRDAELFNRKLNFTSQQLKAKLTELKLVVFDIYTPLYDMILKPTENGFMQSRRSCCGTRTIETSFLCNVESCGTCSNATLYVFWDSFHPSESANQKLALSLMAQGFELLS